MVKASENVEVDNKPLPRARADMINTKNKTRVDFRVDTKSSENLFDILRKPHSFLE